MANGSQIVPTPADNSTLFRIHADYQNSHHKNGMTCDWDVMEGNLLIVRECCTQQARQTSIATK